MRWLVRFSIRRPVVVVTVAVLVLLVVAPGIARLQLRTDGNALVPAHAQEVRIDRAVRSTFGITDPLVVLIRPRHPDGIFNPQTLHLVADLTAELSRLSGLDAAAVRSLSTESSDHFRPGTLSLRRLLEPIPESQADLETLRADLAAIELHTGTLVSTTGGATAIYLGVPPSVDRRALPARVDSVIARADTSGHQVDVIGAPVAEALLGSHILRDLGVRWNTSASSIGRTAEASVSSRGTLSRIRGAIAEGIGLLPLSIAVMAIVFGLTFRSLAAVALPLGEAAAVLIFTLGVMGWTGVPVYLTMAVLPVILVSLGLADEIHIFTSYRRHLADQAGQPAAHVVQLAMDEMYRPVLATTVTTVVGFLSFALSPLAPVRAFGGFTALGILFCFLWSMTVIPACLVLIGRRREGVPAQPAGRRVAPRLSGWSRIAEFVTRRPALTLVVVVLLLAPSPLGIGRLVVQDSWIGGFAPDSDFFRATTYYNEHFYGSHRLLLALDTGDLELTGSMTAEDLAHDELRLPSDLLPDPAALVGCTLVVERTASAKTSNAPVAASSRPAFWESFVESAVRRDGYIVVKTPLVHGSARFLLSPARDESLRFTVESHRMALPDVLGAIGDFEQFIRTRTDCEVGGVLGPADHIEAAAFLMNRRTPGTRHIPRSPDDVISLWRAIETTQGATRVRETVDVRLQRGIITVFLKDANYADTARLLQALREYERAELAPRGIRFEAAGDVAVSQALIRAIVRSQVGSLVGSVLGILLTAALFFRSFRLGLLCSVPAGLAVIATFAVMGGTGTPLGVATSMFASMVLGIGVDFAIHLVERFRNDFARMADRRLALRGAIAATGPPVVVNTLAVALGFGILVLSEVPANARLGAITLVSLAACLAATLLVLPALLAGVEKK